MTVTKNSITDAARVLDLPGDINFLFVLITLLTFHASKKKFATIFFYSLWRFFIEELINKNF